jgi:hypothetical protein
VIEVNIGKSLAHFIQLENESSLLTLHIRNGEITEIENYGKSSVIQPACSSTGRNPEAGVLIGFSGFLKKQKNNPFM